MGCLQAKIVLLSAYRIAPKVLLPGARWEVGLKDTLCQKAGYRGRNG